MSIHAPAPAALFRVIHAGAMTSLQDGGRPGLKAYGIPIGGAMDHIALERVNLLFDQAPHTGAWEMLWGGLALECLKDCWIAFSGDAQGWLNDRMIDADRTTQLHRGDTLRFVATGKSLWTYLATSGGWQGPQWFGSQSVWPDGDMGYHLRDGDFLFGANDSAWQLPRGIGARFLNPLVEDKHSTIRVDLGPQWKDFPETSRNSFFQTTWSISPQSNRAGFRLQGPSLLVPQGELISEPTLLGSIQVPANGQPIVLLNDGPTIGGYAKIAVIHLADLDRFRRMPPGQSIQFSLT